MADRKTRQTDASVRDFLDGVMPERRRIEGLAVLEMMRRVTGEEPKMWGPSIIGFGQYHYRYDSGREGDSLMTGFSPRKQALTIYIMPGFDNYADLMGKLGKYKTSRSCLYIKKLDDVDTDILETLVGSAHAWMKEKYQAQNGG